MPEIYDADKHHWAKIELLRNISHTRIPVRIRKFTADGPVATCVITWVDTHNDTVEVYSEELLDTEHFADAGKYWINARDIWAVEVPMSLPRTRATSEEVVRGPSERSGAILRPAVVIRTHLRNGAAPTPRKAAEPARKATPRKATTTTTTTTAKVS